MLKTDILPGEDPAWDWDDFRIFVAVAHHGSYSKAAKQLGLTQSAVSRRIAKLEANLSLRLFDRSYRGTQLTGEGERLLSYADGAEMMLSRGVSSVRDATRRLDGDCSLQMRDGLAGYWMPLFLPAFLERNPSIALSLYTANGTRPVGSTLFDLEVHYARPLADDLVAVQLGVLHFMLFASQDYLMRYGMPSVIGDLRDHRLTDTARRLSERGDFAAWAGLDRQAVVSTNSSVVLGEAVRAGAAVGLLGTYAPMIDSRLVPLLPDVHFRTPIFVCFDRETGKRPAVRATIDFLKEAVFDPTAMPWFAEEFQRPSKHWRATLDEHLDRLHNGAARSRLTTV